MLNYEGINVNCKDDKGRTLISNLSSKLNTENYLLACQLVEKHKANLRMYDLEGYLPMHHLA